MPKGIYNRKANTNNNEPDIAASAVPVLEDEASAPNSSSSGNSLNGRNVARVHLHNGVYIGIPPNARVEKVIINLNSSLVLPLNRKGASSMRLTPLGLHVFFDEGVEKLVPFANIYEMDLM